MEFLNLNPVIGVDNQGTPVQSSQSPDYAQNLDATVLMLANSFSNIQFNSTDKAIKQMVIDAYFVGIRSMVAYLMANRNQNPEMVRAMAVDRDWLAWKAGDLNASDLLLRYGITQFINDENNWINEIDDTTRKIIAKIIIDGHQSNLSRNQIKKLIVDAMDNSSRIKTIATTEINRGITQGQIELAQTQGSAMFNLITQKGACPICIGIELENPHSMDDMASMPPIHPNCLPENVRIVVPTDKFIGQTFGNSMPSVGNESSVSTTTMAKTIGNLDGIISATVRDFVGDMVEIVLANGNKLSATPNHPIATPSGWVAISKLNVGDDVLYSTGAEWEMDFVDPNENNIIPTIQKVAESFPVVLSSMPSTAQNFHGDGIEGNVYIVRANSFLRNAQIALCEHHVEELSFAVGNMLGSVLDGRSTLDKGFNFDGSTSDSFMSVLSEALSIFDRSVFHSNDHSLATIAWLDALLQENSSNDRTADIEGFCQSLFAFASEIASDKIVEIRRYPFSGHVYNLETVNGWYIADSIITHNCRCSIEPIWQ